MKAAILRSFDAPPAVENIPEPIPSQDQILLQVQAASVHPLIRAIAAGRHYASPKQLPVTLGLDGVGQLLSGDRGADRVYFGPLRPPFGALAEQVAVPRTQCTPIPAGLDASLASAIVNPGLAALLPLSWRANVQPGESVCVLGATGAAGQLAVRLAKLLGAGRIVAVGRQVSVLAALRQAGATDTLALAPGMDLVQAFTQAAGDGFDVMVDYLWGEPTQALLTSIARAKFAKEMRLVQVGEMAGPEVRVPGSLLRSTGLSISGFGLRANGMAPRAVEAEAIGRLMQHLASGAITVQTRTVGWGEFAAAWGQGGGRLTVRMA